MKKRILTLSIAAATTFSSLSFAAPTDLTHITDSTKDYKFSEFLGNSQKYNYVADNMSMYLIEAANGDLYRVNEVNAAMEAGAEDFADAIKNLSPVANSYEIVSVSAINPTTIQVTFNNDVKEESLDVSNFSLSKGTIEAVTAKGNIATISVAGLTYGDTPTLTINDPAFVQQVTVPQVNELYVLDITTDAVNDTIKSDGATKTQITVLLRDRLTGEVVDKDGIIQFTATRGGLGQTTSALQDGKATVQLTSVASATSLTSTITAVVADVPEDSNFEGLSGQKAVTFSPDATAEGQVSFVNAVTAESRQGDRLFVTFSDKINASDYKAAIKKARGTNTVRPIDYGIAVDGKTVAVSDVVNSTPKTLEFILDTDVVGIPSTTQHQRIEKTTAWTGPAVAAGQKNYLRDNVTHTVTFPNKIGSLVLEDTVGNSFILTDTSRPAVLGVTAKDQLEFNVRFTEAMDERTIETINAANKNDNFLLDGSEVLVIPSPTQADVIAAKAANQVIMTSLQLGNYSIDNDGKVSDTRNITTFKMHKDFALTAGTHQIQIANVGDWASDVHPTQNMLVTDTFDFDVTVDTSTPASTVEVQSPEQWRVNFTKPVTTAGTKTAKDVFSLVSADDNDSFVYGVDYMVSAIDEDGVVGTPLAANARISDEQYFLIEFKEDWTVKYNTSANALETYFASTKNPYVLTIENLESTIGNKIAKKDLDVNLAYDGQSPKIAEAKQLKTNTGAFTSNVHVTMSEPVKNVVPTANNEGLTPSEQQTAGDGVPQPTYEFVKGNKVVEATASDFSYDNRAFTLSPVAGSTLESGEWTLFIRSISDDIGNTSATESTKVTIFVEEAEETGTQIAWAAFDDASGSNKLTNDPAIDNDVIYVKFTKEMKASGAAGVSRTQNYVFKGAPLPTGSQVVKGITGVTKNWDGVTILMPKGTWDGTGTANNDFTNALNIASNFTSANDEALSGAFEVELTDTATQTSPDTLDTGFEALYKQADNQASFNGVAAATGATATATANANGKIDTITLTLDKESDAIPAGTEVLVNGKKFSTTGSATGAASVTFTATSTSNQIDGTATKNLKVTGLNSAIIIATGSVEDTATPVITKAQLSSDKKEITLTFSEAVTGDNTYPISGIFKELVAADFGLTVASDASVTITGVEHKEATPNKVVLTLSNAINGATTGDTVDLNNAWDFEGNTSNMTSKQIDGVVSSSQAQAEVAAGVINTQAGLDALISASPITGNVTINASSIEPTGTITINGLSVTGTLTVNDSANVTITGGPFGTLVLN